MIKKDTVDVVAGKVKQFQEKGELHFPTNYSPENAMKSAWLKLQEIKTGKQDGYRPVLEVCSKDSVANSLLNMVVQGLNPAKNQGYFIAYGHSLTFQRSYFGTMAVTKRVTGAQSIDANVIYKGDEVDYEMKHGKITNLTHKQKFGNIDKEKIDGAYAVIVLPNDQVYYELMTMDEIRQAWSKSQMWGKDQKEEKKGSTHDEFKQEMAKKTVINRACKKFINSSDDGSLVIDHFNQTDESAEEAQVEEEISNNANGDVIDIEYNEPEPEQEPEQPSDQPDDDLEQAAMDFEQKEAQTTNGPSF
ncbi:recombinase [Halobacillus litoralis]|uniref:Recombinase n=2 Tax=Halobacillus litoralis TaxID=45668 RepID=A0A410MIZ6_9BACI|nr:recombinase RecT [Halobacillus litoralis]QAS54625.1 recombinase [Halobacillus litoralis]